MLNIYIVTIRNYNTNQVRKITVKASTENGARKLANLKIGYPEGIVNIRQDGDSSPREYENREHCRRIAESVEAYANGNIYRCPECDEIIELPDDVGDKYRCPDCETVHDIDDLEQLGLWDYFDDALDIEYRIGSDRRLRSVQIMVACGGPNIYIDTASRQVELYWWGDRASYPIDRDVCGEIDTWAEELYQC
jgi:hypothetical protein